MAAAPAPEASGITLLCDLVNEGNVQQLVEALPRMQAEINKTCEQHKITPLGKACTQGNLQIVDLLLEHGADVNGIGPEGKMPIHYVSNTEDRRPDFLEILERLLERGVDVDAMDITGCTALFYASETDNMKTVERLIRAGANPNIDTVCGDNAIKVACRNAEFWFFWHSREASGPVRTFNANGFPPVQITKLLLQAGASPKGVTLLPTAIQFGAITMVNELIGLGMDVNQLDDNQRTPLGCACSSNTVGADVVQLLLSQGANVDKGGGWRKQKPLIFAYVHNSVEKIKVLLSYGAQLTAEEMTDIVSLSLSKAVLENPEVINPSSKELTSWRLLLAAGFQPIIHGTLSTKIQRISMCSSYDRIAPWIQTLLFPLRSLRDWCRISIRRSMHPNIDTHIQELPLPPQLKEFLTLKEFRLADGTQDS